MAGDINQVIMIGRVTKDSDVKRTGSGVSICSFSIAVNRRVKEGETWSDKVSFLEMAVFGKTAENMAKYLVKGQQVAIQGSLEQQRWEKDGAKMSKVSVHVDSIQLLGGRRDGGQSGQHERQSAPQQRQEDDFEHQAYADEDTPF